MKPVSRVALLLACSATLLCAKKSPLDKIEQYDIKSPADSFSYAIGLDIGTSLEPFAEETELEAIVLGMIDKLKENNSKISADQAKEIKDVVFKRISEVKQAEAEQKAVESKAAGEAFLAENTQKEGVSTTESGLQYEVLVQGEGKKPLDSDQVKVHYTGMLLDGTQFDSSLKSGNPVTFRVNQVIKGWSEALQLMNEGSTFKLYIPSELAYGERGAGRDIGPNEVLVFEVNLLEVISSVQ